MVHQKIKNGFIVLLIFTTIVIAAGCYNDKASLLYPGSNQPVNCDSVQAKFTANVLPLISSKCSTPTCHDETAAGGFVLQNYFQVSGAQDRIKARVVVQKSMPPTGALLPTEINTIKCWLQNGAPNN